MGLAAAAFLLLLIAPVLQAQYTNSWVKYTNGHIFAVKGSTVNISCSYPGYHKVIDQFWFIKNRSPYFENLKSILEYSGRVENICDDKINRCTLIIRNLTESDSTVYMFIFITDRHGKYYGKPGVSLRVSDLQVIRSTQNLSCDSCSLTPQQNCNLFKTEQKILGNIYYAAPEDDILTDDCTCRIGEIVHSGVSVKAATSTSTEICVVKGSTVDISYAPEGPLVSVSPSGEVEEDTTITLNCSSDANPAANYSWYKEGENSSKSSEQNFVITQVTAKDSGRYSCRVWNLLGHSESTVNVTVVPVWPWKLAAIRSGVGIFLIGLTGVFVLFGKKNTHKKSVETKVFLDSRCGGVERGGTVNDNATWGISPQELTGNSYRSHGKTVWLNPLIYRRAGFDYRL
ncbi:B-cell receptor CD22-like [Takifugu rubripes]|uniref:B-cell receptor CD22-like n=1 Tax=Takifugu rubripes TaxID=31033 RepID=UPI001145EE6A|nr:B-cell receptor CD22-like [Takifugu rubripes]